jgi:hypothetical protein
MNEPQTGESMEDEQLLITELKDINEVDDEN